MTKMFGDKINIRFPIFIRIFNLRQGTIFIAVHQITLSSFALIILLVGLSHVNEMLGILHKDMTDEAERRGFYDVSYGDQMLFHETNGLNTNNQRKFAQAKSLASVTVMLLYTSTIMTAIYLMCCVALFYGAVKYSKQYVMPWIFYASFGVVLMIAAIIAGDNCNDLRNVCGGRNIYRLACGVFLLTHVYCICTIINFARQLKPSRSGTEALPPAACRNPDYGSRVLLVDGGQSNVLSHNQLYSLARYGNPPFV